MFQNSERNKPSSLTVASYVMLGKFLNLSVSRFVICKIAMEKIVSTT